MLCERWFDVNHAIGLRTYPEHGDSKRCQRVLQASNEFTKVFRIGNQRVKPPEMIRLVGSREKLECQRLPLQDSLDAFAPVAM